MLYDKNLKQARIAAVILALAGSYCALVAAALAFVLNAPRDWIPLVPMQYDLVFAAMLGHAGAFLLLVPAARWIRRRAARPATPRLLLLTLILAFFFSVDRIVGILVPPRPRARSIFARHPARGWTNRPNSKSELGGTLVRIDGRGLRVDETDGPDDETGRQRILFVGDSLTVGYYHPARKAFPFRTVEHLNARPGARPAVAINGGVVGYDTRQECHWLMKEGLALKPDLVVHQFCLNDLSKQYDDEKDPDLQIHPEFAWAVRRTSSSGLRRAWLRLSSQWKYGNDLQAAAERVEHFDILETLTAPDSELVQAAWRTVEGQLDLLVDACQKASVPVVLVCFPVHQQILDPDLGHDPQQRLAAFARRRSIPYLDLLPPYREAFGAGRDAADRAFADETHPTLEGHEIAARQIADLLMREGLATPLQP